MNLCSGIRNACAGERNENEEIRNNRKKLLLPPRGNAKREDLTRAWTTLLFIFWKQILRGEGLCDRFHIGLDRRLHVARLLRLYGAGPRQFVPGKVVERDLRGVFVVTVPKIPKEISGPMVG